MPDAGRGAGAYAALRHRFGRIADIGGALSVLHWDHAAMMPEGGAAARARQIATLEGLAHDMLADAAVSGLLDEAEAATGHDPWDTANLREMRRAWRHARAVPADLVEALSVAASDCETAWRGARPANDFAAVAPLLDTVLRLTREQAAAKAAAFGCSPYDALLDSYEPGGTAARIDALFAELIGVLPALHDRALARQGPAPAAPEGPFPVEAQRALCVEAMGVLGFDFHHGRLDRSHHPFTGGVPDDVRLTTRYQEGDFLRGLLGTVHETGHALYEQGLPAAWRRQPVGEARGMVLHESQSLLMEMQVARGDAFLGFLAPMVARALGADPAFRPDNLARLTRRVARGLIRVDSDEIAYPLHVMLRYRLERAMLSGDLAVGDLPGAWNDEMREMLDVVPPDDCDGCMQDVHWFSGAFGYFPTYTLGALAAAQLFAAARRAVAGLPEALARGDVAPLLHWLREQVHGRASLMSTDAVLQAATGAPLETAAYLAHVEARYLS